MTVGQFNVPAGASAQAAAAQIAASTTTSQDSAGIAPALRQATVVSNDGGTPPTCTVTFDGVTNIAGIQYVTSVAPDANDVVNCFVISGVTWITEKLQAANEVPGWDLQISNGLSVANVTNVPMTGSVLEITKTTHDTGTFTISRPGRYVVIIQVELDHGTSTQGNNRVLWVEQVRSGSVIATAPQSIIIPSGVADQLNPQLCASRIYRANTGDTFTGYYRQTSGVTLHVRSSPPSGGFSSFSGQWVGP